MIPSKASISKLFARPSKRFTPFKSYVESTTLPKVTSSPDVAPRRPNKTYSSRTGKDRCSAVDGVEHSVPESATFDALFGRSSGEYTYSSVFNRTRSVESSPSEYSSSPSTPSSFSHSVLYRDSETNSRGSYTFSKVETPSDTEASQDPPATGSNSSGSQQAEDYLDMGLVTDIFENIVNPRARREGMCPGPQVGNAVLSAYKKELLETVLAIEDSFTSPVPKSGFIAYPWEKSPEARDTPRSSPDVSGTDHEVDVSETSEEEESSLPDPCKLQEQGTLQPVLLPAHILLRRAQLKATGRSLSSADGVVHAPDTRVYRSCSIRPVEKF